MADKKIRMTLKDPDGVSDTIYDTVQEQLDALNIPEDEKEELRDVKYQKVSRGLEKWIDSGEYIKIEFDLEAGTAVVLPAKD